MSTRLPARIWGRISSSKYGQVRAMLSFRHVAGLESRRTGIEAATPDLHLLFAVLGGGLALVQTLQCAIVTLVQTPALHHRQPGAVHVVEHDLQRVDCALQVARVAQVEIESGLGQGTSTFGGFRAARFGKVHVFPAGEQVLLVPLAFAVADDHERHGVRGVCHRESFQ